MSRRKNANKPQSKAHDVYVDTDADSSVISKRERRVDEDLGGKSSLEYHASQIDSEDDEEIDSDYAFDEEDEENFSHFAFSGSAARHSESETGEDDDEDEGEEEEEDEEEEDEEEEDDEENDDTQPDDEEIERLDSFIESLDNTKHSKRQSANDTETSKRRRVAERSEAYEESEFNLPSRALNDGSSARSKLQLGDLLGSVENESSFKGLKKQLQDMEDKSAASTLSAPLPKIIQDQLNRKAAYAEAKEEVAKWVPIVKKNREADHLTFPMNQRAPESVTTAKLVDMKPTTSMEKEIQDILEKSGVKEKAITQFENMELNKLSVAEVNARRKELRLMRELAFRDEMKAKRVSKIKSKTYHKIKKKERERNALSLEELHDLDPEAASERQLKEEMERAKERMTLKHRNSGKNLLKQGHHDTQTRQAISESLNRHEALKRKIHGLNSDEDSDDLSENDERSGDDESDIRKHALAQLDDFEKSLKSEEATDSYPGKGVFQMKFMKDAAERQRKVALDEAQKLRAELEAGLVSDDEGDNRAKVDEEKSNVTMVGNNPGRMVIGDAKKLKTSNKAIENVEIGLDSMTTVKGKQVVASKPAPTGNITMVGNNPERMVIGDTKAVAVNESLQENPWLIAEAKSKRAEKKKRKNEDIPLGEKSANKMKKLKKANKTIENVEIVLDSMITVKGKQVVASEPAPIETLPKAPSDNEDSDVEIDNHAAPLVHSSNKTRTAFTQRELVELAFAGDSVVDEFREEKIATMEEDAPKDVDMTLPGWGSWGGIGIKPLMGKVIKKAKPGEGVALSKRKDAGLKHVIINEKKTKKAVKYTVPELPFPYKNKEQYERSIRVPIGKEWNATAVHNDMVKPRILTKLGTVIDPLTAPF